MPLTDRQIRNAGAPPGRIVKLSDGEGLQLWVKPSGAKLWNLAYRFDGKQRKLAIGPFPRVSLQDARARRDEAKRQLDIGLDPSQQKRLAKIAAAAQQTNTFRTIADELLVQKRREGKAPSTMGQARMAVGPRPTRPRHKAHQRNHSAGSLASAPRRGVTRKAGNRPPAPRLHWLHLSFLPWRQDGRQSIQPEPSVEP
jgi:hypothetical protein